MFGRLFQTTADIGDKSVGGLKEKKYREDLDRYSDEYLRPNIARTVDQKILSMVIGRAIPWLKGPEVLEMGYGDGVWTGPLIERFGKSHIVEASLKLIKNARAKFGDKIASSHSYFEDFHPPLLFDSIICSYVLEHLVDPVLVLRRCRSWLKPEGFLFVVVPNATSLHRRMGVVMGLQKDVYELGDSDVTIGHRRIYDALMLETNIEAAGFRIVRKLPMMFKPLPNLLLSHLNERQLRGMFDLGDEIPEDQRAILFYICAPGPNRD
jgi:2-polyprenyl-3-methyl-5-hydroxy-6-metoxy-1,4-benzoquinol methylase